MVEPRRDAATGQVFVAGLHRQPMTKTGATRSIALPHAVVEMLHRRRAGTPTQQDRQPVFAHAGGGWLWPNNVRTKLRGVVADTPLAESAHTRYVGRWAPWSLTARGWTPPGTSWATATLRSPHATTSPTPAAWSTSATRWTRSSPDSSLGPEVVGRDSLAVDPNRPTYAAVGQQTGQRHFAPTGARQGAAFHPLRRTDLPADRLTLMPRGGWARMPSPAGARRLGGWR